MATAAQASAEIRRLTRLFLPYCMDRESLHALDRMTTNPGQWRDGHSIFQSIRSKRSEAERERDHRKACQYRFEEACVKTLYNFSGAPASFDKDSEYKIRSYALELAMALDIPDPWDFIRTGPAASSPQSHQSS